MPQLRRLMPSDNKAIWKNSRILSAPKHNGVHRDALASASDWQIFQRATALY
ncbi:hypothetical protein [Stenotrophomonas terrae]|uniref:hypothetical protein n=1 Tax=Stenotrophomonas terrae TaxID=405446 RepID=UPI00137B67F9|nr:hypothetical protein [Stenotrophomonas terrae]